MSVPSPSVQCRIDITEALVSTLLGENVWSPLGTMAVVGGIDQSCFVAAQAWFQKALAEAKSHPPDDIFKRTKVGEEFEAHARRALNDQCRVENGRRLEGKTMCCNFDLPVEHRSINSFPLGLRRQLIILGFAKAYIKVDLNTGMVTVGSKHIVHAYVEEGV